MIDTDVVERASTTTTPAKSAGTAGDPTDAAPRRSLPSGLSTRRRLIAALTGLALVGTVVTFLVTPVNGNIRYELGVKFASTFSAAETFSHRPLVFRLLLDGMSRVADPITFGMTSFEFVLRLLGLLLAAGAGVLLWRGLRARQVEVAGLHALIAAAAIVFVGTAFTLEPDWMAVVFAIAGTGVALLGRDRLAWPLAALAGALFVASAGMKIITVLTALIGLLVVAVIDRRQAIRATIGSVVIGLLYIGATALWAPWEITWLFDIQLLTPSMTEQLIKDGPTFLLESVVRWPALLLLPAAAIVAGRAERWLLIIAVLLAGGPIIFQAQYFGYHGAALSVVAAVAAFRAFRDRVTPAVGVGLAALVLEAGIVSAVPGIWRAGHDWALALIALAVTAIGIGWALSVRDRRWPRRPAGVLLAACAAVALLLPAMTPFASSLLKISADGTVTAAPLGRPTPQERTAREIRERIGGPEVRVTYLTFGYWPYYLRNPTVCRYPSPLFLQRTQYTLEAVGSPSYAENLACLSEPSSRWLIMDEKWFPRALVFPEVRDRIAAEWNCDAGFRTGGITVCPRR